MHYHLFCTLLYKSRARQVDLAIPWHFSTVMLSAEVKMKRVFSVNGIGGVFAKYSLNWLARRNLSVMRVSLIAKDVLRG